MDQFWGVKGSKKKGNEISEPKASEDEKGNIEVVGNHIYFYCGVDFDTALKLNKALQEQAVKAIANALANGYARPVINLHINSGGGYVHAGISIMDTIIRLKKDVDINTYIEGRAASAATFISGVGTKRFITGRSNMLIHQLSGASWGKYNELLDDHENHEMLMDMIMNFYKEYSNVPEDELKEILSHDLYWTAEKCLEMGLVDGIE